MEPKRIVTVDLGTQNIRLDVAVVAEGEKLDIVYHNDFRSAGINRGKVTNPAKLGAVLKSAAASAGKYLGINIGKVAVSCQKCDIRSIQKVVSIDLDPNSKITSETIDTLKDLSREEAMQELQEGETILAATAQYYNAGDEIGVDAADLEGMMAERLEGSFKIFIGKTSSERSIEAAFKEANLDHVEPIFCGAQMGEAVLNRNEKLNGAAVVDFGAGATSVYIYHAGVLRHYGAIPFGGNSITYDIRNLCDIDDKLAENIKLGYGGCMPERLQSLGEKTLRIKDIESGSKKEITVKYLSEIISARTKEIVEAILYEIEKSGYADRLKNGVILTGGCSQMLNICHYIKQLSGYNARVGSPSLNVFKSESKLFFTPRSATAAALLLSTAGEDRGSFAEERIYPGESAEGDDAGIEDIWYNAGGKSDGNGQIEELGLEGDKKEDKVPVVPTEGKKGKEESGGLLGFLFNSAKDPEEQKKKEEEKKKKEEEKKAREEQRLAEKKRKEEERAMKRNKKRDEENGGGLFNSIFDDDFNG